MCRIYNYIINYCCYIKCQHACVRVYAIVTVSRTVQSLVVIGIHSALSRITSECYYINYYYYYFWVRCAGPGESEDTLSVQRPQRHTTNPWKDEKDKTVGDKKERADHANRKALALLLKPASPTRSNTGSVRLFQRDTERGCVITDLLYWKKIQY